MHAYYIFSGEAISTKFKHLSLLLRRFDPEFWCYLKRSHADDLLFSYRWLLLEAKREFPLDDALQMLEVQWASIPPDFPPADDGLALFERGYRMRYIDTSTPPHHASENSYISSSSSRENLYARLWFVLIHRNNRPANL